MKEINTELVLIVSNKIKRCPARIEVSYRCDTDDEIISICVSFDNADYYGIGNEYTWEDAFADLQRNLPQNVRLACCLTCRHGNMCPYGNEPRVLFCTKGLKINSKSDMIALFDAKDADGKREVLADAYCDDFEYQSRSNYTYNDYLFYLEDRKE